MATGLLQTTTAPAPAPIEPDKWQVDPSQTVQGQVEGIIAKDSPLMQQAATTAKQNMAPRGLLNSSMAVGAGQNAVIQNALPIAQQDAATNANAGQFNATQGNAFKLNTQQHANTLEQMGAQQGYNLETIQKQADIAQGQTRLQYELDTNQKVQLANISAAAAEKMANIEAQYKNLNQASASAASIMNTTMSAIARIMEDSSLDSSAKQRAIDIYNANAETSLALIGSLAGDVDLASFYDQIGL